MLQRGLFQKLFLAAMLPAGLWPAQALATARTYQMAGGLVNNADSSSNYATLEAARSGDSWAAGDVITLLPGTFPSGGLTLNVACTLQAPGGATLEYAVANGTAGGVLNGSAAAVVTGPLFLRDTSTHGSGGRAILWQCSIADVDGLVLSDIEVTLCPAVSGYGPIELRQSADPGLIMRATLTRVKCTLDGDYRDVIATTGIPEDGRRGRFVFRSCEASNATSTGGAGGGTSNGCFSCDAAADHELYDCIGRRAGGSVFEQVSTNPSLVRCFGCWGEEDQVRSAEANPAWAVFTCEQVFNSFAVRCVAGHRIEGSSHKPGLGMSADNAFIRDPARTDLTNGVTVAGIFVRAANAQVGPVWVEGWRNVESSSSRDAALNIDPGANGWSCRIEDAVLVDCFRGITTSTWAGALDLERTLVHGRPAASSSTQPLALRIDGTASAKCTLRMSNCLFDWQPTPGASSWYTIVASNTTVNEAADGGYNYIHSRQGAVAGAVGLFEWTGYATDDINTHKPPELDQDYRQRINSPARTSGRLQRYLGDLGAVDPNSGVFTADPRGDPDAIGQGSVAGAVTDTTFVSDMVGPLIISRDNSGGMTHYRFAVAVATNAVGVQSLRLTLDASTNGTGDWVQEGQFDFSSNGADTIGELREKVDALSGWTATAPWGPQHLSAVIAPQAETVEAVNDTGVVLGVSDYFNEKTLLWLTGRLAPQFRRITAYDPATATFTVNLEFADPGWDVDTSTNGNVPQLGDRFVILPYMIPGAGDLSAPAEFHLHLRPWLEAPPRDATGRMPLPDAAPSVSASLRYLRCAPGPLTNLPQLYSGFYRPDGVSGELKLMRWEDVMNRRRASWRR